MASSIGGGWSHHLGLLPVGYAVSWVALDHRPDTTAIGLVAVVVGLAVLHKVVPALVELAAGGAALVLTALAATDEAACGEVLGTAGSGVVLTFAGVVSASAFVQLLGTGSGRKAARHLLAGTAALGVTLLLVDPTGRGVVRPDGGVSLAMVLSGTLLATTLIGVRSRLGFPMLGAGLLSVQALHALSSDPCTVSPALSLLGMATFVLSGAALEPGGRRSPAAARPEPPLLPLDLDPAVGGDPVDPLGADPLAPFDPLDPLDPLAPA